MTDPDPAHLPEDRHPGMTRTEKLQLISAALLLGIFVWMKAYLFIAMMLGAVAGTLWRAWKRHTKV